MARNSYDMDDNMKNGESETYDKTKNQSRNSQNRSENSSQNRTRNSSREWQKLQEIKRCGCEDSTHSQNMMKAAAGAEPAAVFM